MKRFRTVLSALGVALLVGGVLAAPALAWPDDLAGPPAAMPPDAPASYFIWHDEAGFHLRTTGPGPRHLFRAKLTTDGEFRNVRLIRLEGDDGFRVRNGGHTLELRFETFDAVDGVDFTVEGGDHLRFALRIDDRLAPTGRIFLGPNGHHPPNNPFVVTR